MCGAVCVQRVRVVVCVGFFSSRSRRRWRVRRHFLQERLRPCSSSVQRGHLAMLALLKAGWRRPVRAPAPLRTRKGVGEASSWLGLGGHRVCSGRSVKRMVRAGAGGERARARAMQRSEAGWELASRSRAATRYRRGRLCAVGGCWRAAKPHRQKLEHEPGARARPCGVAVPDVVWKVSAALCTVWRGRALPAWQLLAAVACARPLMRGACVRHPLA